MRSLVPTRGLLVLVLVVLLLHSADICAGSRFSIRVIGGPTRVAGNLEERDATRAAFAGGAGVGYELASRHSVFVDIELLERVINHPKVLPFARLTFVPITLGYRWAPVEIAKFFSPLVIAGVSFGPISEHDKYFSYPGITPYTQSDYHIQVYNSVPRWRVGPLLGFGCSARVNRALYVTSMLQYRFLHYRINHSSTDQSYLEEFQLSRDPLAVAPVPVLTGGLEAKLVFEFRL